MKTIDYTCNAIIKRGGRTLICEKTFGHVDGGDLDHQAGKDTWRDQPW